MLWPLSPAWMFSPLDISFEYWIQQVTFGLLYVMFRLSTTIFYREFQALQLIVLVVLAPWIDHMPTESFFF